MTNYFPSSYEEFIYKSRYARWNEEENRREEWPETVERYINNLVAPHSNTIGDSVVDEIRQAILNFNVMPSMRALMTAGPALDRDNVAGYNCSYLPIDDVKSFDEAMYILLCGTGVGYSVERQNINRLPEIPEQLFDSDTVIVVKDSKAGWAKSYRQLLSLLYSGEIPKWDISRVRPAGSRLKTFGGRASGPEPLVDLFRFTIDKFKHATGRKLTSVECHDILCKIGEVVVVGGVRRSAMISLSNLSDDRMRQAKNGQWWIDNPQRALANNSAVYLDQPDVGTFFREWISLYDSKSGERGLFSRGASQAKARAIGRNPEFEFGTNPCSEIILRPYQFCNLTEVVVRAEDTIETLRNKIRIATILGTIQSTLTYFPYLRKIWRENTEEERLLGVSLTGIMDNVLLNHIHSELPSILNELREYARNVNAEFADKLGIPRSSAITCVKPSGTVSQLVNSASGIHPRHSTYYIRSVRIDKKDPVYQFLLESGVPVEDEINKPEHTAVFYFPIKAPEGSVTRDDITAIDHLNLWSIYNEFWCEHKPSITVSVREREWPRVGAWVFDRFNDISGISFLPHSEHTYKQPPYDAVDRSTYEEFSQRMPSTINFRDLSYYERGDTTVGAQTLACSVDGCEVVDLT